MRRLIAAVIGAAVVTGGAATVAVAADPTSNITRGRTLHLVASADRQTTLDFGSRGFSLGDQRIAAGSLRNRAGTDVGRFNVACTVTDTLAEGMFQCLFTLAVPGGQVTAHGLASSVGPESTVAVTGGTSRYQNARGQIHVRQLSATTARLTVSLIP